MSFNKGVFLDRDGVITEDPPHYAHRIDQLSIIPGSAKAIRLLNENGFRVIVISNQSGVARGYYTEDDVNIFNNEMVSRLAESGAHVDAIFYCPHHPEAKTLKYRQTCTCRKPHPGMLIEGSRKENIDFALSFVVGDKWSDIEAGRAVGCRTVLVKTGHGLLELEAKKNPVDYIASDLLDAVQSFILSIQR